MQRKVYSVLYWIAAVAIGLGAFGHGIGGARELRAALAAAALDPKFVGILWIVWYFVSGSMLLFGGLSLWAWFVARRGRDVMVVPVSIGAFYILFGAAAFVYARDSFWLFFLAQGVMLLAASLGLRRQVRTP